MKIAILTDFRFPGGTASALAAELDVISPLNDIHLYDIQALIFRKRPSNKKLVDAADRLGLSIDTNSRVITADIIIFHNPILLKFEKDFPYRLNCQKLIVVTHENFYTPQWLDGFDITYCLSLLHKATIAQELWLAPVSPWNRSGVTQWVQTQRQPWNITPFDWFNICDFTHISPQAPRGDRRGRLSRPGLEKFPDMAVMKAHFPQSAETHILGADSLAADPDSPYYWNLYDFGTLEVDDFFSRIDFFIYYTKPTWRESFGRVIAEAIAAGKLVITDIETAKNFDGAVIADIGSDLDILIEGFKSQPQKYIEFVSKAQKRLEKFSPVSFQKSVFEQIPKLRGQPCFIL